MRATGRASRVLACGFWALATALVMALTGADVLQAGGFVAAWVAIGTK